MDLNLFCRSAPSSAERTLLQKYAAGEKLRPLDAIRAKCGACCGLWIDGRHDCEYPSCPLYPYQPYRASRQRYVRPSVRQKKYQQEAGNV